jgi:hypothetical protein
MIRALKKIEVPAQVYQEIGTVTAVDGQGCTVLTGLAERRAQRAVSCLVAPEAGDRVLLAAEEGGGGWVLAVLERRDGAPLRLEATGDVAWRLQGGRFSVAAPEGLDLTTGGQATLTAGELSMTAAEANLQLDRVSFLGRLVHANVETVKLFAGALDSVIDRFWQRVKRSYRFVEGVDHVSADQIDYNAKMNAQIHGRNALVTADQLVKVDGEQIHVG